MRIKIKKTKNIVPIHHSIEEGQYQNQDAVLPAETYVQKTALVIGAGSVGSNLIYNLFKIGCKSFFVFDNDIIENKNKNSGWFKDNLSINRAFVNITNVGDRAASPFKVDNIYYGLKELNQKFFYKSFKMEFPPFNKTYRQIVTHVDDCLERTPQDTYYPEELDRKVKGYDIVFFTTDSLRSRLESVLFLHGLYMDENKTLPLVDIRITDAKQGQLYCIDLCNIEDFTEYVNTLIDNELTYDEIISLDVENVELSKTFDGEQCGNRMSVLSATQGALLGVSYFAELFKETVPNFKNIKTKTFFGLNMSEFNTNFIAQSNDMSL